MCYIKQQTVYIAIIHLYKCPFFRAFTVQCISDLNQDQGHYIETKEQNVIGDILYINQLVHLLKETTQIENSAMKQFNISLIKYYSNEHVVTWRGGMALQVQYVNVAITLHTVLLITHQGVLHCRY